MTNSLNIPANLNLLHAGEETLRGRSLDLIIPEKLRSAHWVGFRAAVAAGKVTSQGRALLTRATHKSGDKLYVELSFAIMSDEKGNATGAIGIARDVTQRHLADRARNMQRAQ